MDANTPLPPLPPARPQTSLAIAALVVGILAFFSSILVVGAFLGVLGIVLAAIHISRRKGPNGMAWAGIALSVFSILISAGLVVLYVELARSGFETVQRELAGATAASAPDAEPEFSDWIGKPVPDFRVASLDGKTYTMSELKGHRLVLDFWATWCPPCRREIPHFIQLAAENPQDELLIIGISSEDENTLEAFADKEGVNYPIVSEDELPEPFNSVTAIPTTFFIDRNGIIQNVIVGYHDYEHLKELALADDFEAGAVETPGVEP